MGVTSDHSLILVPLIKEQTGQGQHEIRRLLFPRAAPERKAAPLEHGCAGQLCTRLGFSSVACPVIPSYASKK